MRGEWLIMALAVIGGVVTICGLIYLAVCYLSPAAGGGL